MTPFTDKLALVTGAGSGLGRALCLALGREGGIVVATDIDLHAASDTAAAVVAAGGRAHAEALDVTDAAAVSRAVDAVVKQHGRLDLLINNAGFAVAGEALDIELAHWRRIVEVNLMGVVHGTLAAYPLMARQRGGCIVNIASLAGLVGAPLMAPYATTKFAVVGLTLTLRAEAARHGVAVNAVCPGFIETRIFDAATVTSVTKKDLLGLIPFKFIPAEEAAARILQGVARNQAFIVFPFYARVLWWLYRLSPALMARIGSKAIADAEKLRVRPVAL